MSTVADAVVVGGSVAGAATAAFLARRGRSVVVLDRARFPRDKPCGEGILPHGVEILDELGALERLSSSGASPIHGVRYVLETGESIAATFPTAPGRARYGIGVRRTELDVVLRDSARDSGAELREGVRVRSLQRTRDGFAVIDSRGNAVSGRILIGADGAGSRIRSLLGWSVRRRLLYRYAAVGHFRVEHGREIAPLVEVILAPGMESYVTPLGGGEVLVALLGGRSLMRRFSGDLAGGYGAAIRSQARLRELLGDAEPVGGVLATGPFAVRASRVAGRAALLVGDAAGFLDPITGEGMASGLEQAKAAARAVDSVLDGSASAIGLKAYALAHRRLTATGNRLTWVALALCASPALSRRALSGLQRRPELLQTLLAINCRRASLSDVRPRDWLALVTGR